MITQDSIEALKARLDIVDVIGNYIELRKNGANFKARCPFHDEKSPSFNVNPQKQIYHCFGCGAGGDAIKFVMEYEKLSYPEALEKLAQSLNFTLHYDDKGVKKERSKLMDRLSDFYSSCLEKNTQAKAYLHERGVFESSIEHFGIGYAPASQQTLGFIKSQMFRMDEAVDLGVVGKGENGLYARFIERITFPIHSPSGALVGFGGRTISGHAAKYVNSPQSEIFNKSRLLYAYHHARESIHRKKEIIITEGYLDVVMLHQAGFTQAVATLGTALTAEHLPLLQKGEPRVIMAYDGDDAGQNAALKAAKLLSTKKIDGGVVLFEGGLDPADMVKSGQIEALGTLFRQPQPFIPFVLERILSAYRLQEPLQKEQALHECIGYLKTLSPLMQEEYRGHIASRLGISPALIKLSGTTAAVQVQPFLGVRDIGELGLIKTMLEHPRFVDQILDFIDGSMLTHHGAEFALALQGRLDDPRLMALRIDPQIRAFENDTELKAEMRTFLRTFYLRRLKTVTSENTLKFEKKAFLIRTYRDKISRLERGELVSFDG
ncbi:MAG: DNA primase [Campylobacterales bacterium]|nr:DNA primase [Campylobacterales bacterium]